MSLLLFYSVLLNHFTAVFFNFFFEVEPFAAILIAHGTHGRCWEYVLGHSWGLKGQNSRPKAETGEGVLGTAPAVVSGGVLEAPQRGTGQSPNCKCIWTHQEPRKRV